MIVETEDDPTFELPPSHNDRQNQWQRWIDTALESPDDIVDWRQAAVACCPATASKPDVSRVICCGKRSIPQQT